MTPLLFNPGIYLLVDPAVLPPARWSTVLPPVLQQGLAMVQLRVKNHTDEAIAELARPLQRYCEDAACPFLLNDNIELAAQLGTQGVHLGQSDGDIHVARQRLGPTAIIGRTCHDDPVLIEQARLDGANYASVGALFNSRTKPHARPASLSVLQEATQHGHLPLCAIGGIDAHTLPRVAQAGATLVAVCSAILQAPAPTEAARHLVRLFADERKHSPI